MKAMRATLSLGLKAVGFISLSTSWNLRGPDLTLQVTAMPKMKFFSVFYIKDFSHKPSVQLPKLVNAQYKKLSKVVNLKAKLPIDRTH